MKIVSFDCFQMGFVSVGKFPINSPESVKFAEEKITSDPYILEIMEHGLKLDFSAPPGPYYEPNNQSRLESNSTESGRLDSRCLN